MATERRPCKAMSRQSGQPCKRPAEPGSNFCIFHGGNNKNGKGRPKGSPKVPGSGGPPPKGCTNALKHGAYSARLLPDEQAHFECIKAAFEEELGGEEMLSASDRLMVFRLATNGAKITSAMEKGAGADALVPLMRFELEILRELKTTRATKNTGPMSGNTPAEVVCRILAQVDARRAMALAEDTRAGRLIEARSVDDANGGDVEEE